MEIVHHELLPTEGVTAMRHHNHMPHTITPLANVALLGLTATDPPTQAEVQAVADKVDELVTLLIAGGLIAAAP